MLEAIRFVNCQSFEDVTIDFATDKINILKAPNNTGKSVLFKMLKITANPNYLPPKKRSLLIRRGATSANMICAFTDGSIGITSVYEKSVIFRFKMADEDEFTSYNEAPEEYLKGLGLIVDKTTKFVANIVDTDQDMLLVNSDQKGNHNLLKLLAEDATLMDVKSKLEQEIVLFKKYNSDLVMRSTESQRVLKSLEFADIPSLQRDFENSQILIKALNQTIEMFERLEIVEKACENNFNYNDCINLIDGYIALSKMSNFLEQTYAIENISDELIEAITAFSDLQKLLVNIRIVDDNSLDDSTLKVFIEMYNLVNQISVVSDNYGVELSEALLLLDSSIKQLNRITYNCRELCALETSINNLMNDIVNAGKQVECPIYGKVIYNGEECVPYNI